MPRRHTTDRATAPPLGLNAEIVLCCPGTATEPGLSGSSYGRPCLPKVMMRHGPHGSCVLGLSQVLCGGVSGVRGYYLEWAAWVQVGSPPDGTSLEKGIVKAPSWACLFIQLLNPSPSQVLPSDCFNMHRSEITGTAFGPVLYIVAFNSHSNSVE